MLIERELSLLGVWGLNLSSKYTIIYLEGSPESRKSQLSSPEDSLFLRNLDFQNPKNNSLLLKLSFDGLIDPKLFNGRDYACFSPNICQFISKPKTSPYISLIKLSSWVNMENAKRGDCNKCSVARNLGDKTYCPIVDMDDHSGITFGIYFSLTNKEFGEYINLRDKGKLALPVAGLSLIPNH